MICKNSDCNKEFTPYDIKQKYCSAECRLHYNNEQQKIKQRAKTAKNAPRCWYCGTPIIGMGNTKKYCCKEHKKAAQVAKKLIKPEVDRLYALRNTPSMTYPNELDGYVRLANEIITLAMFDYRFAMLDLKVEPFNINAIQTIKEVKEFAYSDYFAILTRVNPEYIFKMINKELPK